MTKGMLEELRDKYQKKADKNYWNYQETGESRYLRESQKAEDIADAVNIAIDAEEDHNAWIRLSNDISMLASRARWELRDDPEKVVKELISIAENYGLIRKD